MSGFAISRLKRSLLPVSSAHVKLLPRAFAFLQLESKYAEHSTSSQGDFRPGHDFARDDFVVGICIGRSRIGRQELRIHLHYACSSHASGFSRAEDLASASL